MPEQHSFQFEATGTVWDISFYGIKQVSPKHISRSVIRLVHRYESVLSRFRPDSFIRTLSGKTGTYTLPSSVYQLFVFSQSLSRLTNGAFTPFIGTMLAQAGYDDSYRFRPRPISTLKSFDDMVTLEDGNMITFHHPGDIDFGAFAKGYIVDCVAQHLNKTGHERFLIDAGGDLYMQNEHEQRTIGLENPNNSQQIIGVCEIDDGALCGSSGNRRTWHADWHHIINPHTKTSVKDIVATWVYAQKAYLADALATALFFVEPRTLSRHYPFAYVVMRADSSVLMSPTFPGKLFR